MNLLTNEDVGRELTKDEIKSIALPITGKLSQYFAERYGLSYKTILKIKGGELGVEKKYLFILNHLITVSNAVKNK